MLFQGLSSFDSKEHKGYLTIPPNNNTTTTNKKKMRLLMGPPGRMDRVSGPVGELAPRSPVGQSLFACIPGRGAPQSKLPLSAQC